MKLSGTAICCQKQLITSLNLMNNFYKFGDFPAVFFKRLANVLLNGVHNMYKDQNSQLFQTSLKKARLGR